MIGPRIGGSERERQAADYLAGELGRLGLEVEVQPFKFLGWEPLDDPVVKLLAPVKEKLVAAPFLYGESTA
jgi:hypothetical protein